MFLSDWQQLSVKLPLAECENGRKIPFSVVFTASDRSVLHLVGFLAKNGNYICMLKRRSFCPANTLRVRSDSVPCEILNIPQC